MKLPLAVLLLGLAVTGALAQSRDGQPAPVIASPFQALGNVIRNPDADPPRTYPRRANPQSAQPAPPPSIIPPGTLTNPDANSPATAQTPPR